MITLKLPFCTKIRTPKPQKTNHSVLIKSTKKTLFLPPNPRPLSPCFINILIQKMDFLERTLIPHMG